MRTPYPDKDFLLDVAHDAGEIMISRFNTKRDWVLKDDGTPLTPADTLINQMVLERFRRDHPHVNVLGEEGDRVVEDAEFTALCDPIDGTSGFALGIPVSAFCLSILEGDTPVIGVIYDPFQARMWIAERGYGTTLNGKVARVSMHKELKNSNVMLVEWNNCGFKLHEAEAMLMEQGSKVQNITSLAYFGGLIASGTVEGSIFPGKGVLETAVMQIIIEEAGGTVTDLFGDKILYKSSGYTMSRGAVASNGVIHDRLLEVIDAAQSR